MEAEFKGLLTNLIIMETRVSDRNEGLLDLLKQLADARAPDRVPVDSAALTEVVQSIIEASHHVGEVAGEER
jgi:nitrogen-specific signal transduction histidine kinase